MAFFRVKLDVRIQRLADELGLRVEPTGDYSGTLYDGDELFCEIQRDGFPLLDIPDSRSDLLEKARQSNLLNEGLF